MEANPDKIKQRVQTIVVICGIVLLVGKFGAYYLTNSVGILTDAMESIVNVVAGLISLYAIRLSAKPKDNDHPFGHGKIELISASIEGILIFGAGGIIIYEGIQRLFSPPEIQKLDIGIAVIAIAGVVNYILGWYSIRQGKKYDSIALVAGGKHLQSDTYSTIGLVAGLLILYFTKITWIDSALAIIFGGVIAITGIGILRNTIKNLIDTADRATLERITKVINENRKEDWIDIHNLKVLKYGSDYFIDCDLTLPWFYNITEGHRRCEDLRRCLLDAFPQDAQISIHADPCLEKYCSVCQVKNCKYRKKPFVKVQNFSLEKLITAEDG
ncbi:cation diffusion facilitator family transporter [Dysgonomonas hofstadii]|uniref:Cation diffusion facilitator family transporter n=1 Tax=Dysgonomonas hofstadii TaxID=637886 RepID=A0A840CTD0_9BACT|nr:cation diffusion facilitator family transporter [Dysgonomonas hofstadii]MBB4036135.1 cation diffusion facilitator family transporter [Dysgonomonas hofstadii]